MTLSDYTIRLKERRPEIADFLLRCERGHAGAEDFTAMRHSMRHLIHLVEQNNSKLHKLALSMQEAITPGTIAANINLISLGRTLLAACHEALITSSASAAEPVRTHHRPALANSKKPTLLSIDDDRIIHQMVEGMFGEHFTVLTAGNGVQGLVMIGQMKPDLVLLDDAMPQMSGMKMIEELCATGSPVRIIMLTSSDRPQDIARATAAGAVDYIIKPLNPQALADAVYKALRKATL